MKGSLLVVGDALLDRDIVGEVERVCPDAPAPVVDVITEQARPGGAALAALLAARSHHDVVLVAALADDDAAETMRARLRSAGVRLVELRLEGATPEKVRIRARGSSLVRIDRAGTPAPVHVDRRAANSVADAFSGATAVLAADYGRGLLSEPSVADQLVKYAPARPVVWDPHPRGGPPAQAALLATPNEREVGAAGSLAAVAAGARAYVARTGVQAVVVTMGERGALLAGAEGAPLVVPARRVIARDACGAGDCFAVTAAAELAEGAVVSEAVVAAVEAASDFVASGGVESLYADEQPDIEGPSDAESVVARVRARGGTVVATGGCFDLLHAGHVATLRAARQLGDCLVVLINSDESVRRLKGADRPLQPANDRAAVLRALACVDAVQVFDSDTPVPLLESLRPDVFAKGGDYALGELPEARALARWGGQVVVLPYLAGRSTTQLVEEAHRRGR